MGNRVDGLRGRGPLGVGKTYSTDGRRYNPGTTVPKATQHLRVWFDWNRGVPALFEFEPEYHWFWGQQADKPYQRRRELTYKPKTNRSWYEIGDLVLYEELEEWRLIERYPELAPPPGEEASVLANLVIGLLLGPPDEYKLAHKITKITPTGSGKGKIELSPVLFLDDKTFIELEKIAVRNQLDLSFWWASIDIANSLLAFMRPAAKIFYEASWALASGGIGSAARGGGRRALLLTLRQARRHIATRIVARKFVVYLSKNSAKATMAGTRAFMNEFAKTYRSESKKQGLASRASAGSNVDRKSFEVALKKAAGAFASSFITTLLDIGLDKVMKDSGYSAIQNAVSKRIIQAFTGAPEMFIKAISAAWAAEAQNPGSFDDQLAKNMFSELKARFTSLAKVDFKNIGESLSN